jgi:O-antigen/teichoic acid export membrane protein
MSTSRTKNRERSVADEENRTGTCGILSMMLRIGFAVIDQAIYAGSSFFVTLLLARWMTQSEFGAFSVVYSVYVFGQNIYEGLVSEPFGIFGAGRLSGRLDAYLGRVLIGHAILCVAATAIIFAFTLFLYFVEQPILAGTFGGLGIAITTLFCRVVTRQPLYITSRIHWSAFAGFLNLIITLGVLALFKYFGVLSPFYGFVALGGGSLVSSAFVIVGFLKPRWRDGSDDLASRRLIVEHLLYARWAVSERLLLWFQTNVFFLELTVIDDLHSSGVFRAITTLAMPGYMVLAACNSVVLPALVRGRTLSVPPVWDRFLFPGALALTLAYGAMLFGFGVEAGHILYGGRYDTDLRPAVLYATSVGLVLFSIEVVLEIRLRAAVRIRQILIARVVSTVFLIGPGTVLMVYSPLFGASVAMACVWLVTIIVHMGFKFRRKIWTQAQRGAITAD